MNATGALRWRTATIAAIEPRTPTIRSFYFALPDAVAFVPGQHMDVRLTAEDGYEAQRSYSIASAPDAGGPIELAIERLADGEVSPFFHDVAQPGDEIELRGPIGGHFVWSVADGGPVLLVGGGSGVAPLASMVRHHALRRSEIPVALATSARTVADLLYAEELRATLGPRYLATVTRDPAARTDVRQGRIDDAFLRVALDVLDGQPRHVFVCGANAFVEHATQRLVDLGVPPAVIRTERYGG